MHNSNEQHGQVIAAFLEYLNANTGSFILKGGTALLMCYGLDRFSEDIDLDGMERNIQDYVHTFCGERGYTYRVAKDTDTVKRYMVNYGAPGRPLKIEVSYRRREISADEIAVINGVRVYILDTLCIMKANAYTGRDAIRDLYDLAFICNNHMENLTPQTIALVRNALEYKGIEQFDYMVQTQEDELIDNEKLAEDFLLMFDRFGLLYDAQEQQMIDNIKRKQPGDTIETPPPAQLRSLPKKKSINRGR